ncbi:ROK family protein [Anaerolineales bacterium HSG25]|nr:ROK family protein [Anaerolineales bacterium HSG25]
MKRTYRTGDQALVREINLSTILRCLQSAEGYSRARLATLTGLNKTTVSSLAEELLNRNLIHETRQDSSGTGRPATLLEMNPEAGHIIGLELGVDFVSVILTNFVGKILWKQLKNIDPETPQEAIIGYTLHLIDKARTANLDTGIRLLGVGVTLPGMVDVETGTLLFSPNLRWRDIALYEIFHNHTGLPVYIDNDANAAAIGEHLFGVAQGVQHFIFLSMGVGIGSGLFLNGQLYRGGFGIAGEIGHTNLMADSNRPCRCGKRGCWETSCNQYALIERARALLDVGHDSLLPKLMLEQNSRLTVSLIAQAAEQNDEVALEALADIAAPIGMGISNLVNIFNPDMVVLGGMLSLAGKHLLPTIKKNVNEYTLVEMRQTLNIVQSDFGPTANVVGAIALVVNAILNHPNQVEVSATT